MDDVTLESMVVSRGPKDQVLVLKGLTVVNGTIVFESGEGIVQVENPEVVIKGSVQGAVVKNFRGM